MRWIKPRLTGLSVALCCIVLSGLGVVATPAATAMAAAPPTAAVPAMWAAHSPQASTIVHVAPSPRPGPACDDAKPTKKRRQTLRQARRAVIAVAKQYPAYSGHRTTNKGCTLRLYGTKRAPRDVTAAMNKASKRTGMTITWNGRANFNRADLRAAAAAVRADRRVRSVSINPYPGELLVQFKPKFFTQIARLQKRERLQIWLGVDVPIVQQLGPQDVFF